MADKEGPLENRYAKLRRQAEDLISQHSSDGKQPSTEEIKRLVHELEVHQVELEMQNEELMQAQLELEKVLDRYANLYDFAPVGYLTLNDKGIILEANLTAASMLRVERNKLVKKQFANFIFREDQDTYYFFKKRLSKSHIELAEEMRLIPSESQGGELLFALLEGLITPDEGGELICHLSISNIGKQKVAQKGLVESEQRFRTMSDFTTDWEYWIGPENEFVYISPSCEMISGYGAEEFRADPGLMLKIVHPEDQKAWQTHVATFLHSNQPGSIDLRIVTPSGRVRWINHLCRPVYDKSGQWLGRRISNRDITERKSAEKEREKLINQLRQARELQQLLSRRLLEAHEVERQAFARELHDEVGQALTALKINLQTVQRGENCPDLSESIAMVEHTLQQVRAISLNLPPTTLEDLGLAPALRWVLDHQSREAGFSTSFTANLTTRLPPQIEIACFRVGQEALTNIMRHAHAHQVKMELEQIGQELHLTIEDDGGGFDVEAAYERARIGTSLGLISMRERVLLSGGHMEIESKPGQGTHIHASFPLILHHPGSTSQKKPH
jgi:PAS domain S-box-containing protein